jgi:hypothetical protein
MFIVNLAISDLGMMTTQANLAAKNRQSFFFYPNPHCFIPITLKLRLEDEKIHFFPTPLHSPVGGWV